MLFTTALPLLALASSTLAQAHGGAKRGRHANKVRKNVLGKRENGRMTFYDTSVGAGACGIVHQNDEWTVALNGDQKRALGDAACGAKVTITYGGKTATATVQDECPSQYCSWGQLDLSEGLFEYFASKDTGVIYADWYLGSPDDTPAPTTTTAAAPPAETTSAAPQTTSEAPAAPTTTSAAAEAPATTVAAVESSAAPASASASATESVASSAPVVGFAAESSAAASSAVTSSAPAASATASETVSEDADLPWCDELEDEEEVAAANTSVAPAAAATTAVTVAATAEGGQEQGGGEQAVTAQAAATTTAQQAAAPAPVATVATVAAVAGGSGGSESTETSSYSSEEETLGEGEEWCDEEPVVEAAPVLVAADVCPDAGSIVLVQNSTILYNNTLAAFTNFTRGLIAQTNTSLLTSTNVTLPTNGTSTVLPVNGTQLIQNVTALCYNATLFPVANIASWTNFTSLFLGGNASAPAVVANETRLIGLDGTVNGTQGSNSTLSFLGYLQSLSQQRR